MPRPRSLTQDRIAAAALAVIDRDGLAALSMRAVSTELGVSTMALYRYVDDRRELEGLVVELVLGGVDVSPPSEGAWQERIAVLVGRMRDHVGAHPEAVPLTMIHRHGSAGVLRWSEAVLAILAEAGLDGPERVIALRGLLSYVIGAVQLEHLGPLSGEGTAAMAGLSPAEFPHLAETAGHARLVGADEEFRGGLAMVLRGIRAGAGPFRSRGGRG
ncbi:TetR/AcrR family transcriptional regulator [Planomonospora sp. ID91781]|uniref:Transcriptional regulator n=3 Tax=Planomonospora TaxID=1998 RepID=A0A161LM35_9ACTN|nr:MULTISPECIES: TetR/AcrR family transcriptional regulator C-terminal domain-containing protein [Planomonospora]MBG0824590.1 TetR/AcrR family transcriptional regulator [Planomonospora sp. ID91781]GAT68225.1 transcriptional regulator [Planomonospora sphaerica]GGK63570.1 TetR family transcriptional regulator [Planomonospora parontospora]GII08193.1 TetR family transcriptional regulator [Planomonospora parontospora subsp. parontospora]